MGSWSPSATLLKQTKYLPIKSIHNTPQIQMEKDIVRKHNRRQPIKFKTTHKTINRRTLWPAQRRKHSIMEDYYSQLQLCQIETSTLLRIIKKQCIKEVIFIILFFYSSHTYNYEWDYCSWASNTVSYRIPHNWSQDPPLFTTYRTHFRRSCTIGTSLCLPQCIYVSEGRKQYWTTLPIANFWCRRYWLVCCRHRQDSIVFDCHRCCDSRGCVRWDTASRRCTCICRVCKERSWCPCKWGSSFYRIWQVLGYHFWPALLFWILPSSSFLWSGTVSYNWIKLYSSCPFICNYQRFASLYSDFYLDMRWLQCRTGIASSFLEFWQ